MADPTTPAHLPTASATPELAPAEIAAAVRYAANEKAQSTRRAYRADFEAFRAWCAERNVSALPAHPGTIAGFLGADIRHPHIDSASISSHLCETWNVSLLGQS
jgi:hypothetical protein